VALFGGEDGAVLSFEELDWLSFLVEYFSSCLHVGVWHSFIVLVVVM
jgi:hypothetical protein